MSTTSEKLGFTLYEDSDAPLTTVKEWRDTINTNVSSSALRKIDAYAITTDARIDNLEASRKVYRVYGTVAVANNYVATNEDISELSSGIQIQLSVDSPNTDSSVLNINSIGNKMLQKLSSTGALINLQQGDLIANKIYTFEYNGTTWIMMGGVSSSQVVVNNSTAGNLLMVANDKTIDESNVYIHNNKIAGESINIGSMLGVDGNHNIILPASGVTAGTYIGMAIDTYGRVTGVSTPNPNSVGSFILRVDNGLLSWSDTAPNSDKFDGIDSDDFATKITHVTKSTAQAIPTGTTNITKITWDSVTKDDTTMYDSGATTKLTVKQAGYYDIFFYAQLEGSTVGNQSWCCLYVNNLIVHYSAPIDRNQYGNQLTINFRGNYAVNDYLEIGVVHDFGSNKNIVISVLPVFSVMKIG